MLAGNADGEGRALPQLTLHLHRPSVTPDDGLNVGQSDVHSHARLPFAEADLEDSIQAIPRDAKGLYEPRDDFN